MPMKLIEDARKEVMKKLIKEIKPFFKKSKFIMTIEFGVGGSGSLYGFCSDVKVNGLTNDDFADAKKDPFLSKLKISKQTMIKEGYVKLSKVCEDVTEKLDNFDKKINGIEDAFVRLFSNCWITLNSDGSWSFREWM